MRAREFIVEMFDKPWNLISNTVYTDTAKSIILDNEPENNGKHLYVWQKEGDPSQIITRDYIDGYWEIHHTRFNWKEGTIDVSDRLLPRSQGGNGLNSANARFFSTIIHLYMDLLRRGLPVKILAADEEIWEIYNRVIDHISKSYDNYIISDVKQEYDETYNAKIYYRTIVANKVGPFAKPLTESQKMLISSIGRIGL